MSDSLSVSVQCILFLFSHTLIQYGSVPLGIAALNGHTETVTRLLELGADVNMRSKVGMFDLINAIYQRFCLTDGFDCTAQCSSEGSLKYSETATESWSY